MESQVTRKVQLMSLAVIAVTGLYADLCLADVVCVPNSGNTKRVCVAWSQQTDPYEGTDFVVDYECTGCADAPDVELRNGDTGWIVYSEVISTGAPANIGALTTTDADNYGVKIAKGTGPGAANLASALLLPDGGAYYSSLLAASSISGDLLGDLTLQKSSGGTGGTASFTISGDVLGNVTIPEVSYLSVYGNLASGVTITIDEMVGDKQLSLGGSGSDEFSGTLLLPNGLDDPYASIAVPALLTSTGSIDFNDQELGCQLTFGAGSSTGSVLTAGAMSGDINYNGNFAGTATFASMSGTIELEGADVAGTIDVAGDWSGTLYLLIGDLASTGVIHIGGDLTDTGDIRVIYIPGMGGGDLEGVLAIEGTVSSGASIDIDGNVSGYVAVLEEAEGDIEIGGDITSTGHVLVIGDIPGDITVDGDVDGEILANVYTSGDGITGDVTIDGEFNGNICADNLSPLEGLPQNISIDVFGDEGLICGARPGCGDGTIGSSDPANGTRDARQPHPPTDCSLSARQGIGSEEEPIEITLSEGGANNIVCWELCETGIEDVDTGQGCSELDDNAIKSVTETGTGVYEIVLERPISAGHWTTITYLGDDSYVAYASLPADANASGAANAMDTLAIIDYLNESAQPPYGLYSTDIDHTGVFAMADYLRLLDLLNGTDAYIAWNGESLPSNTCPQ